SCPLTAALVRAFIEFADLQLEERHFDEALAILEEARSLRPEPAVLDRLNLLGAEIEYRARRFDAATADFERVANSNSQFAPVAMFNAALGALQTGDQLRFIATANEFAKKGSD